MGVAHAAGAGAGARPRRPTPHPSRHDSSHGRLRVRRSAIAARAGAGAFGEDLMAAPRIVLTPALQVQIVASIRAGGFGHVAAQAWGVAKSVYESWLARGQGRRAREPYRSFAREVAAAQYQARLRAETGTFEEDSKFWPEHGPGRALRNEPGWGSASKPPPETPENKESLLASPEFRTFGRDVREVFRIHQPELV